VGGGIVAGRYGGEAVREETVVALLWLQALDVVKLEERSAERILYMLEEARGVETGERKFAIRQRGRSALFCAVFEPGFDRGIRLIDIFTIQPSQRQSNLADEFAGAVDADERILGLAPSKAAMRVGEDIGSQMAQEIGAHAFLSSYAAEMAARRLAGLPAGEGVVGGLSRQPGGTGEMIEIQRVWHGSHGY